MIFKMRNTLPIVLYTYGCDVMQARYLVYKHLVLNDGDCAYS